MTLPIFISNATDTEKPSPVLLYELTPHVERQPIFTDLAGNPVHEGDKFYFPFTDGQITDGIAYSHTIQLHGSFLHRSDCEKWVASNVKTNTDEECLRYLKQILEDVIDKRQALMFVNAQIKEKCFTPKS